VINGGDSGGARGDDSPDADALPLLRHQKVMAKNTSEEPHPIRTAATAVAGGAAAGEQVVALCAAFPGMRVLVHNDAVALAAGKFRDREDELERPGRRLQR
jgi:hypothetical protein